MIDIRNRIMFDFYMRLFDVVLDILASSEELAQREVEFF